MFCCMYVMDFVDLHLLFAVRTVTVAIVKSMQHGTSMQIMCKAYIVLHTVNYTALNAFQMQNENDFYFSRKVETLMLTNTEGQEWADSCRYVQERIPWASAALICGMLSK